MGRIKSVVRLAVNPAGCDAPIAKETLPEDPL
jgi:hypothetical protein